MRIFLLDGANEAATIYGSLVCDFMPINSVFYRSALFTEMLLVKKGAHFNVQMNGEK